MENAMREVFSRRNLLWQLVLRDLKVRYSRPFLGFFWSFLSPLCMVGILYLIFARIFKAQVEGAPFILYLMSAIFTWNIFQESVASSAMSLLGARNLIKEAQFPHYFIPLSIIITNLLNAIPCFGILFIVSCILFHGVPWLLCLLPLLLLVHLGITFGLAVIVSILYVKWRDVKYILDAVLLLLFYLTPAFYSFSQVEAALPQWAWRVYLMNPLVGILSDYRILFFKGFYPYVSHHVGLLQLLVIPPLFAVAMVWSAIRFYHKSKLWINDYLSY